MDEVVGLSRMVAEVSKKAEVARADVDMMIVGHQVT
jgi:hypothetical protein